MADDPTNPFAEILGALKSKGDSSSTRKGIRKDGDDKVKPVLNSNEVQRLTNVFKILKGVLFPGPEAKRIATTKKNAFPGMAAAVATTPKLAGSGGLGIKTVIAAAIAALVAYVTATFDEVSRFFLKTGLKVIRFFKPITNMLKVVGKTITKVFQGLIKSIKPVAKVISSISKFFNGMVKGIKSSKAVTSLLKSGKGIWAAITKAGAKVGAKFLKFGRFIPVLGSLFSFGFAFAKFTGIGMPKDFVGGMLELVSGILNLIPLGATQIASGLIDGYILFREFGAHFKEGEKGTLTGEMNMLGTMKDKISTWLVEKAQGLPIIGNIVRIGLAVQLIKKGGVNNILEGFKMLGGGLFGLMGGGIIGLAAMKGFGFVMGLFKSKGEVDPPELPETSSFGEIIGGLFTSVGNVLSNIWEGMIAGVKEWVANIKQAIIGSVQVGVDWIREKTGIGFEFVDNILADGLADGQGGNSSNGSSPSVNPSNAYPEAQKKLDVARNAILVSLLTEVREIKGKLFNPDSTLPVYNNTTLMEKFDGLK